PCLVAWEAPRFGRPSRILVTKSVAQKRDALIPTPILVAFGVLVAVLVLGTVGYHIIEGFSWFDSAYMSLTTVTTLGDSPVRPETRMGRLITLFVVSIGFGVLSYALVSLVPFVVEGHFGSAVNSRS